MRGYYLSPNVGTGIHKDPFRALVFDHGINGARINLAGRAFKGEFYSFASVESEQPLSLPDVIYLGDSHLMALPKNIKNEITSRLATNLGGDYLCEFILELLQKQRAGMCPPLIPCQDGRIRLFLNRQIYGAPLPLYGHRSLTDNFNRGNQEDLGTASGGGTWVESYGDWDIDNNRAMLDEVREDCVAYIDSALSNANQFAECDVWLEDEVEGGAAVRVHPSDRTCYYGQSMSYGVGYSGWAICMLDEGDFSILAFNTTDWSTPNGATLKTTVDGNSLILYQDDVQKVNTSDTTITDNLYIGIAGYRDGSNDYVHFDNFLGDVLVPPVTEKESSDTGAGVDVITTDYPLAQSLRSESGTGADTGADYPAAFFTRGELAAGIESLLARVLAVTETGNGSDDGADFPAVTLTGAEAAVGVESLLARLLVFNESGAGLDTSYSGNPLAGLLASDNGLGMDTFIALVQSFAVMSSDIGLGLETPLALSGQLVKNDNGLGDESIISRLFSREETGLGMDVAALTASVFSVGESGSGTETLVYLPEIVSNDVGLGSELIFLLKALIGYDEGKAVEIIKYLIATAGQGTDMRLNLRPGQSARAGDNRQAYHRHGQIVLPSKEVDL